MGTDYSNALFRFIVMWILFSSRSLPERSSRDSGIPGKHCPKEKSPLFSRQGLIQGAIRIHCPGARSYRTGCRQQWSPKTIQNRML